MKVKVKTKEELLKWFSDEGWKETGGSYTASAPMYGKHVTYFNKEMFKFCGKSYIVIVDEGWGAPLYTLGEWSFRPEWLEEVVETPTIRGFPGENGVGAEIMRGRIDSVMSIASEFLKEKNRKYGNSATDPINIFSSHIDSEPRNVQSILVRIDDKLKRIQNAEELRSNDVIDLFGYLPLLIIAKDWDNIETFNKHME